MAGLRVPLSLLHPQCCHRQRRTRGRSGWLVLPRTALSSAALSRFSPALSLTPFTFSCPSYGCLIRPIRVFCDPQESGLDRKLAECCHQWRLPKPGKPGASGPHSNGCSYHSASLRSRPRNRCRHSAISPILPGVSSFLFFWLWPALAARLGCLAI